jgi:hypothetical protein
VILSKEWCKVHDSCEVIDPRVKFQDEIKICDSACMEWECKYQNFKKEKKYISLYIDCVKEP